ncbi:spondin-1-like [Watersipora subatra]|uniref:spondin-1-like n=1 Tax=Watersipora subatra TaxID=2589382 RepID=UPI00355BA41E
MSDKYCYRHISHVIAKASTFRWNCSLKMMLGILVLILCQSIADGQRLNKMTCARRPTHTSAHKTPGDNGFSIKILGSSHVDYYEPGHDYTIVLNGSYANQQFLDFMLVATLKEAGDERQTAGSFFHLLSHMTTADEFCSHVMTSITFHPSYKKSAASFRWTAPRKGSGCVIFKATVVEHPDIWFSDDGGLTKMFCEKPEEEETASPAANAASEGQEEESVSSSHSKRQSSKCCACDVAKYEMTFVGNWSRETHPKDFPDRQHESLLHWSDIIGASHSPSYSLWSYGTLATTGVKEVCEYGWPRTLEGEIKQQSRNVRTVIKTSGIWGYPALYETQRSARFSTDNNRPYMSLLSMVGPSPDWCIGIDSLNMCLENCTWLESVDLELYPWDAGTDGGVTYLSSNLPTYPREKIQQITNVFPNNTASPFYGEEAVRPMATVRVRRVGGRSSSESNQRCEAGDSVSDSDDDADEAPVNVEDVKCMVTEWSEYTVCSVTCGIGVKTRSRSFKHPMGTLKRCPHINLQESSSCLGLVNICDVDPNEPVDICITTPWSYWSPCSVSCGPGSRVRTRQYLNAMGQLKCSQLLMDSDECTAQIADCSLIDTDWNSVCVMDAEPGVCSGNFTRFYYNVSMQKCQAFSYGGCRGNENRFDTMGECERSCAAVMQDIDSLPDSSSADADVDCMVTEWTDFSQCSVSCGTGLRSRTRMIKRRNSGSGASCPKDLHESVVCASECPSVSDEDVDCMISEWSVWSDCSATCGDGVEAKLRMIKRPAQGQGLPCPNELKEMRQCNLGRCEELTYPLCMLSEWTPYSECSVACGTGKKMRSRMMKQGPCPEDTFYSQVELCEGTRCDGLESRDCVVSEWNDWSECDERCGKMGEQTRFRMILQPAINGGHCAFEEPKQMEKRACYNGECPADVTESISEGPVDCIVDTWADWSACSKTCGIGKQIRRRTVIQKRRKKGARCGALKEVQECDTGYSCRSRRRRL